VHAAALDWTKTLDLDDDAVFGEAADDRVDPGQALPTPVALPVVFTDERLAVAGRLENLSVLGLVTGSCDFALNQQLVAVDLDGNAATTGDRLSEATLLTFSLSNPTLSVGPAGFGLQVTSGALGIAALAAPVPSAGTDDRRWLAATGKDIGMSLALTSLVTGSVTGGRIELNDKSGTGASAINWAKALDINGDSVFGDPNGGATSSIRAGSPRRWRYRSCSPTGGHVAAAHRPRPLRPRHRRGLRDEAASWTCKIRMGRRDAGGRHAAVVRSDEPDLTLGVAGFGFHATSGGLALGMLRPASDTRTWTAVVADLGDLDWSPVSGVHLKADHLRVEINQSSAGLAKLNWETALDLDRNGSFGDILVVGEAPYAIETRIGGAALRLTAEDALIQIEGFLYVSGTFVIEQLPTGLEVYTVGAASPTTVNGVTVGGSNVSAFVGLGNPDLNGDGNLDDPLGSGSIGLLLQLHLRHDAHRLVGRRLLRLEGRGGFRCASVQLVGVPGVGFSIAGLMVEVNGASGASAGVDFARSFPAPPAASAGLEIATGATSVWLDFSAGGLLRASGRVTLTITGVSISAGAYFEQTTRATGEKIFKIAIGDLDIAVSDFFLIQTGTDTDRATRGIQTPNGLLLITSQGVAAKFMLADQVLDLGNTTLGVHLAADLELAINTSA
jgi:hypothetical protein